MRKEVLRGLVWSALSGALCLPAAAQDLVARGAYLVNGPAACGNCHTQKNPDLSPRAELAMAGGMKFETPGFVAYARNITPDKETGIGAWTDAQVIRAMREGVTKEGQTLGPPMPVPTYHIMADEDAKAIVAFLRTLKPIHNEVPESKYKFPLRPMPPIQGAIAAPPKSDKVAYGGYLVNGVAHCFECHTSPGPTGAPDVVNGLGAGGFPLEVIRGNLLRSRNITPDKETGIGAWTDDEIKRVITTGVDRTGKKLVPLMPFAWLANLAPDDLDAIVAYLRTIKPVANKVEPNFRWE